MKGKSTFIILLFTFFCCQASFGQATGDYRSNVSSSGDWSLAINWERFNGTAWVTAITAPTSSDGVITIRTGDSITLTTATNFNQLEIESGGILAMFNNITATNFTLDDAGGNDIIINGRLYVSTNATLTGTGTIQNNSSGLLTISNGGILYTNTTSDGTIHINNGASINNSTVTNNNTFILFGSSPLNLNTSTLLNNSLISLPATTNCFVSTTTSLDTGFITNTSSGIIFKSSSSGIAEFSSTIKFINDGTVKGIGEYVFANTVANTGIISPGDNSTNILTVNPSFITGKTPTVLLEIGSTGGIAGTNYDQLKVSDYNFSTVNFTGTTVTVLDNALDLVGTVYTVILATQSTSTITGPFGTTDIPSNFGNTLFSGDHVTIEKLFQNITWDGGAGTSNWNDANNWNPNLVPRSADHVIIETGTSVLINTAAVCRDFTLNSSGAVVSIQTGNSLIVNGILTLTLGQLDINGQSLALNGTMASSGTGTIKGSSASSLTIGGTAGGNYGTLRMAANAPNNYVGNFTLSRTGTSSSATIGSNGLGITGIMTVSDGVLITAGNLTMVSSSISSTGLIAPIINAGAGISGLVTIERYVPASRNAYRDIAPAINSGTTTIFHSWQEGGTNTNGYGTQITGSAGTAGTIDPATGFDRTQSGGKSMHSMNVSTITGASAWETVNSTSQLNDTLSAFKAFRIAIRGNRLNDLSVNTTIMNAPAILRSRGTLITGQVSYTTTSVTANGGTNTNIRLNSASATGYSMIGNPYQSPIDWESIQANSTDLDASYWVFDPNMGTTGAYVTYNATSGLSSDVTSAVNQYIQPGQGFFVRNSSITPTLLIQESDKATNTSNLTNVFRTVTVASKLYLNLVKQVGTNAYNMDGCGVGFSSSFSNGNGKEDAGKITNGTDNLAINRYGTNLSIEGKKLPTINDTISIRVWLLTPGGNYKLKLNLENIISNGLQPILLDRFTNTQTTLNIGSTIMYPFTVTADTMSFNNRFRIVFSSQVVPISFNSIKAYKKGNEAEVEWSCNETDAAYYEVEHSTNSNSFNKLGTVAAKNSSSNAYTWHHSKTPAGTNFYRIKSVDKTGNTKYSSMVSVSIDKGTSIGVYPNPVRGTSFTVQLQEGLYKQNCTIELFNNNGQKIFSTFIASSSSPQHVINLNNKPSAGTYQLSITAKDGSKANTAIIIQ
jgi:hypothetical protein